MKTKRTRKARASDQTQREIGRPGSGKGRKGIVGRTGIYSASGPAAPSGTARIQGQASWGQGEGGAAGFEAAPRAPVIPFGIEKPDAATFDLPAPAARDEPASPESRHIARGTQKGEGAAESGNAVEGHHDSQGGSNRA